MNKKYLLYLLLILLFFLTSCGYEHNSYEEDLTASSYELVKVLETDGTNILFSSNSSSTFYALDNKEIYELNNQTNEVTKILTCEDEILALNATDDSFSILSTEVKETQRYYFEKIYDVNKNLINTTQIPNVENADEFYPPSGIFSYDCDFLYQEDANGNAEPLFNWTNYGIDPENIIGVETITGDIPLVVIKAENTFCFYSVQKKIDKDSSQKKELILAGVNINSLIKTEVNSFNYNNSDYKILLKDFSGYDDPYTRLYLDFLTSDDIDLILLDELDTDAFIRNGLLENISEKIKKKDYVSSYISLISNNDNIFFVAPAFSFYSLVGNKQVISDGTSWTFEDFRQMTLKHPEAEVIKGASSEDLMRLSAYNRMNDFISNSNPSFDILKFEDVLSLVSSYSRSTNDSDYFDYLNNGSALLAEVYFTSPNDYRTYKAIFGKDMIMKGYPSDTESGLFMSLICCMGISSKSQNKDIAWNFIETLLNSNDFSDYGFPTYQKNYDSLLKEYTSNDDLVYQLTINGESIDVPLLSKKDVKKLNAFISSIDNIFYVDSDFTSIMREESDLYFSNLQSLDDTLDHVKSRIEIAINEKE